MQMYLQALELELTPEEMKKMVPATMRAKIQGKGILQAYTVAHEGKSQPRVVGEGQKPLHWTKSVVRRLSESIQAGAKFFVGHGETNSHDGRSEVGEVLTSFVKEIKGRLSNIVIGWFPNENVVREMDVCSIEANVETSGDYVDDVNEVSAIALGASAVDSPAFPGAMRLASLQCFEEEPAKKTESGEDKTMATSFTDVKDFIRDHNVFAHQLYTEKDLRDDREFATIFESGEALKKENEELAKKLEESEKTNKEIDAKAKMAVAKDRFDELVPKDLTKKQKEFIASRFNAELVAGMDDDAIKEHIEKERKVFAETAKLFGVTENQQSGNSDDIVDDDTDEGDSTPEEAALKLVGVG